MRAADAHEVDVSQVQPAIESHVLCGRPLLVSGAQLDALAVQPDDQVHLLTSHCAEHP